ncbi:hypothetical protein lbkm_1558 [Lachnospiraceae bacterium KM106-2]|nr:hypothetical protein lbkm_1558 [Lachnospiraceae bacterium KM106-2]
METFKDYKVADISDDERSELSQLEQSLCKETDKDIVLIAYEKKTTGQPL